MFVIWIIYLMLLLKNINASPIASVYVKFVSPPDVYEHGITTDGGRTIAQNSYQSIGRRSVNRNTREFGQRLNENNPNRIDSHVSLIRGESLWPVGIISSPLEVNDLGYSAEERGHRTPDYSDGLAVPDIFLLTGKKAMRIVQYIYGRGELFYDDYPHIRSLLRNQEERKENRLDGHILKSLRYGSPFFREDPI